VISSTVEDYLKTLLKMEDSDVKASTSNVARQLSVTDASVTDMLRKLQKTGLLEYRPYYGATLTPQGRLQALKIMRRHRLIELFLHQVMGYGWDQVHKEAEKLEHVVSDFFVERADALLGYPEKDPHGEVIPDAKGYRNLEEDVCLAAAELGEYTVRKITNDNPEFLTYLERESLIPGTSLDLIEKAPFQGPLKLLLSGKIEPCYIGLEAAKNIYVSSSKGALGSKRLIAHGPDRALRSLLKTPNLNRRRPQRAESLAQDRVRKRRPVTS
jgi:DtxR family transcriptional regulator, Mn-dependent transcriptional regulator